MIIKVKFELEEAEKAVLKGLGVLKEKEGIFPEPLTAEEMVKELKKVAKEEPAEEVPFEAEASKETPKKAKAAKSTPKADKPAPEAPQVKEDALREAFYAAMKAGKKAEVKAILAEYGVGRVSEIPKDKRAEAIKKAEALM